MSHHSRPSNLNWKIGSIATREIEHPDGTILREFEDVYKLTVRIEEVITDSQDIYVKANMIELKNEGNTIADLNGAYTINPGEARTMGSWEILHLIDQTFRVGFDSSQLEDGVTPVNALERVETIVSHPLLQKD